MLESLGFVMTWFPSYADMPEPVDTEEALRETSDAWRGWADSAKYEGPCRQAVIRSLITLKALIHQPTGGIVAAPTSSSEAAASFAIAATSSSRATRPDGIG